MTKIEDSYFDDNGAFSEKCKVYLGVTRERLSYDCAEYLTALNGGEVAKAMNTMISEDMAKRQVALTKFILHLKEHPTGCFSFAFSEKQKHPKVPLLTIIIII